MKVMSNLPLNYNIIGYGICGNGESSRYLKKTLNEFQRLCDHTVIVGNNLSSDDRKMINEFGFELLEDDREWGTHQHKIKQDLMYWIAQYNPKYCVALDMDEVFDPKFTKDKLVELLDQYNALYFYIVNLWGIGWNRKWSFWNVRAWKWNGDTKIFNKPLHCGLAPEWCYYHAGYAPYYVMHYGLKEKKDRQRKIERYQKFDPKAQYKDRSYYDALAEDKFEPLDLAVITESIEKEIGVQHKRGTMGVKKAKLFYIRRFKDGKDLGVIDVAENILGETLKRNPEWINEGEIGNIKEHERVNAPSLDKTECPFCGRKCLSGEALLLHKQTHG